MDTAFDMTSFLTPDYSEPDQKKGAVLVRVYDGELPDPKATAEHGRPINRSAVMVKKMTSRNHIIERELTQFDLKDPIVAKAFRAYQARKANASDLGIEGTPLEELTTLSAGQREIFKGYNIYTVEQLASLNDLQLQQLGAKSREAQRQAKVYLQQAKDGALSQKLAKQNEELSDLVKTQTEAIEELKREVERLKNEKGKKER